MTREEDGLGPKPPALWFGRHGVFAYLDTWILLIVGPGYETPGWRFHLRLFPQSLPTPERDEIWAIWALDVIWAPRPTWFSRGRRWRRLSIRTSSQAARITDWLVGRAR